MGCGHVDNKSVELTSNVEIDMKREILAPAKVCAVVVSAFFTLLSVSCTKGSGGESVQGLVRLKFEPLSVPVSKVAGEEIPDTNDFILKIVAQDGSTVYDGPYGRAPEAVPVPSGSCTVSVRSAEFPRPAFASPQYGDDRCIVVPAGGEVSVELVCTQVNSGIRLKISPDFLTAYPEGVLFVRGEDGQLMYGYSERRVAYFLPGNVSVVLSDAGRETILMTRAIEAREILSVRMDVAASQTGGQEDGISVRLDTSRVWTDEGYVLGEEGLKGDSPQNAMTVALAKASVGQKDVWVSGYIVGGDLSSSDTGISYVPPFDSATNMAVAARASVSSKSSCLSVQLPAGDVRDALNLVTNPGLIGRRVCIRGDIAAAYFGLTGIKNVSDFVLY